MTPKFGATGRYPRGHADASDEGELHMGIAADHANGIVRLEFGKRIAWLGIDTGTARQLAQALIEKADDVDAHKA